MELEGEGLTLEQFLKVARNFERVKLSNSAREKIESSKEVVRRLADGEKLVYGITTGFGEFAQVKVSREQRKELQLNLLRSHACGVGKPLSEEEVRGAMLLRANTLAKGNSGVRVELVEKLIELLNKKVYPYVPEKGSVGASGDLAPLAHMALLLVGEGKGFVEGRICEGKECLKGIEPVTLEEKEGLALINGTPVMTSIGALSLHDSITALKAAEIACAMSIEALLASKAPLDERIHEARGLGGQIKSAKNLKRLIANSEIIDSHAACRTVQDAYSLRCAPQVLGCAHESIAFCRRIIEKEMNASCDNPLVFADTQEVISAGNFHGEPVAQAMDFLAISMCEVGNISERRSFRYMDERLSNLPAALIESSGLNSGLMLTQYVAAALVSENKVLAHPASVDSIPTAADQEDHVSMGTIAARKAKAIVENVKRIIAIELICASQALDFRRPLSFGDGSEIGYKWVRERVKFLDRDRSLSKEIEHVAENLEELVSAVEREIELEL